jgi:magnesium chelatase family protein
MEAFAPYSAAPGPSGPGTSRLARRLTTLLPSRILAEALETTRMHRVASLTDDRQALVTTRHFRTPPHPITEVGLIGGDQVPLPGEVSTRARPPGSR